MSTPSPAPNRAPEARGGAAARRARGRSVRRDLLLLAGLYAAVSAAAHLAGFRMPMDWTLFQLLDRELLTEEPARSLWYLHAQPPLFNAVTAVLLRLSEWTGLSTALFAKGLFLLLGLLGAVLLFGLLEEFSRSRRLAWVVTALVLASPGNLVFANKYFYPYLCQVLLLVWATATVRYLKNGRARALSVVALSLVVLCATRALYHPVWAVGTFACVVLGRRFAAGDVAWKPAGVRALWLLVGVLAWPAKNALVFDHFSSTTWDGYNLAQAAEVRAPAAAALASYIETGAVGPRWRQSFDARFPDADPVARRLLLEPTKSDGSRNWNHWMFVATREKIAREGWAWRFEHPREWLHRGLGYYGFWSRATFARSYQDKLRGPEEGPYAAWARAWNAAFFRDLRPALGGPGPDVLQGVTVPLPLYGVALFPLLLLSGWIAAARRGRLAVALAVLFCIPVFWSLVVPCLTDGIEANRMRFASTPLLLCLAAAAWPRRRGAQR